MNVVLRLLGLPCVLVGLGEGVCKGREACQQRRHRQTSLRLKIGQSSLDPENEKEEDDEEEERGRDSTVVVYK